MDKILISTCTHLEPAWSAAQRLIDEGEIIRHAEKDKCSFAIAAVSRMNNQKIALAKLAFKAAKDQPATMFRAMLEGWSAFKIRFELDKLARATQ